MKNTIKIGNKEFYIIDKRKEYENERIVPGYPLSRYYTKDDKIIIGINTDRFHNDMEDYFNIDDSYESMVEYDEGAWCDEYFNNTNLIIYKKNFSVQGKYINSIVYDIKNIILIKKKNGKVRIIQKK